MRSSQARDRLRCFAVALSPFLVALATLACSACVHSTRASQVQRPVPQGNFGAAAVGQISVRHAPDRPSLTIVLREGDPSAAIAFAVFTEGGPQLTTALASIVEARLQAGGFPKADVRTDPDGYRVRALVSSPEQATQFVVAARQALLSPLASGMPVLAGAKRRLELLRTRPYDSLLQAQIARCTGELGWIPGEAMIDPTSPPGVVALEELRKASHTVARVAFSVVGPSRVGQLAAEAMQAAPAWERGTDPKDAWPEADQTGVHVSAASAQVQGTLTIAVRVRDPFAGTAVAERAADPSSPLLTRLGNAAAWRLARVTATVRPRGACLSFRLDRDRAEDATPIEADAASVAGLVAHEVQTELAEVRADGSVAGSQVLRALDPRDAAALAAWWSLSAHLEGGNDRFLVDLGVPPGRFGSAESASALDTKVAATHKKFSADLQRARAAWQKTVVETKSRVEAGQGEFWLLAGSPCGVLADTERDAGITALAAVAATAGRDSLDQVSIEPWISAEGVGVIAHALPRPGEGPQGLARRVADVAARALLTRRLPDRALNTARGSLLGMVDRPSGPFGPGLGALALSIAPSHPAWIAPFGLQESLAKAEGNAASFRWASLADGPIRVAVLANVDQSQADSALRAVDRWMLRRVDDSRSCPPLPPVNETNATARDVTVRVPSASPYALVGVAVQHPEPEVLTMMDLLAEGLEGPDGWLAKALSSLPNTRASARVVGGSRLGAIVVDITGPESGLDDAVRQVRGTIQRLAKGAASAQHLARASQRLTERDLEARLDPRRRIGDLWSGRASQRTSPTLEKWNTWMRAALVDSNISTARVLASEMAAPQD